MPCIPGSRSPNDLSVMRNPLRLTPKSAHLVIPLIANLLLAACDTGGQLPYEEAGPDQGASGYETTTVAEPDPAFNSSKTTANSNKATAPTPPTSAASNKSLTAELPEVGNPSAAPSPADTATPATTSTPDVAAQTAKAANVSPAATVSPVVDPGDRYLLTPSENDGNPTINYQQSNSKSAPVVVAFAANDPQRIDVIVRDSMPVSKAILTDPQRQQYPTASIDHKSVAFDAEGASDSDVGVNVMTNPSTLISGVGVDIPIVPSGSTASGSLNESRFSFVIPNRDAYNSDWQHWKIHIDLGDAISGRSMELLPPKPQRN